MANPFEELIQLELPKRPFLASDVQLESVIIRRGAGPRQLAGLVLAEGQVLGMSGGVLTGVDAGAGGTAVDSVIHVQDVAATSWVITHNRNNVNVIVSVYDATGKMFNPDDIQITANAVTVTVIEEAVGRVVLLFVPEPPVEP